MLLLCRYGFACFGQALLLAVRLAVWQAGHNGCAYMVGNNESEYAGVADIEADDPVPSGLQFACAMAERAANIVANIGQSRTRDDMMGKVGHQAVSGCLNAAMLAESTPA